MEQPISAPSPITIDAPRRTFLILIVGVFATSLAAILIRYAQNEGVPSLFIAAARLTIASILLTPFTWRHHGHVLSALRRHDFILASASGFMLALHFASWIASLEFTTVLISVVFVTTGPLWVALLEFVFLRIRLGKGVLISLLIAITGGIIIGVSGNSGEGAGPQPLLGASLALFGAISFAIYLVIGRKLRAKLSLLPYIWLVYSFAALFLIVFVVLSGTPFTGYSGTAWLALVLLAVFPQLIGHTSFNYALRYLPATLVSIATQMEPIGSAIAAMILFRELPTEGQILGSVLILASVVIASLTQNKNQ